MLNNFYYEQKKQLKAYCFRLIFVNFHAFCVFTHYLKIYGRVYYNRQKM